VSWSPLIRANAFTTSARSAPSCTVRAPDAHLAGRHSPRGEQFADLVGDAQDARAFEIVEEIAW
jgi:hypothetical protein